MDVGEQGDAEVHQVPAEDGGLAGPVQGHSQGGGGGHGANGGEIGRAIVAQHLPGVFTGIDRRQTIQHRQPQIVPHQHDQNDQQEHGQLPGDGALVGQAAEGAGDEEGQDGDDDPGDHLQHDMLELLQQADDGARLGPGGGQTDEHGEHQGGDHRHDGGDLQLEQQLRRSAQPFSRGLDGHAGDEDEARSGGQQGGAHRRGVGQEQGQPQHPGGVALQPGDGGGDEADDDEGHAEGDERSQQVLHREDDLHHRLAKATGRRAARPEAHQDAGQNAQHQAGRQTAQ